MENDRDAWNALPVLTLPLERLFTLVDLRWADPWGVGSFQVADIANYNGQHRPPPDSFDWHPEAWDHAWTREDHLHRIWELTQATTLEPIWIDLGQTGSEAPWPVIDGHHRILAAWLRGDTQVEARIAGASARIERAFGCLETAEPPRRRVPAAR